MKILIPLKQVPDSTVRVSVAPDGKSIKAEGITWSISPYDEYAIEMALERKDADPSTVVALVTSVPMQKFARGGQVTIVSPGSIRKLTSRKTHSSPE